MEHRRDEIATVVFHLTRALGTSVQNERLQKNKNHVELGATSRGALYIGVWCQVDQRGWDTYAGSEFVVEFQLGYAPVVGSNIICRQRIARMLSAAEREEIRRIMTRVMARGESAGGGRGDEKFHNDVTSNDARRICTMRLRLHDVNGDWKDVRCEDWFSRGSIAGSTD
jgi:hypothetical protein